MEPESKAIECIVIYPLKSFSVGVISTLIGTFSTIGLARWLDMPVIGIVGFLIFFVGPLFYNKFIKDYFTKRVLFTFHDSDFVVEVYNLKTDNLEETTTYKYQDIKSCTLSAKQDRYSALIILFNAGKKERFTFIDDIDEVNSSKLIYQQITEFSSRLSEKQRIELEPHFYASKTGTRIIIAMSVAMIGVIIYQLAYAQKGLPISFAATIVLFITIILRRQANINNDKNT